MSDKLEGLDEEIWEEEARKEDNIASLEEVKKKRRPFHYWTVNGVDHKMKLATGMVLKLENKYRTNVLNLVMNDSIPPLSVLLTVAQAAISPWENHTTLEKVQKFYDKYLEEGGSQLEFYKRVIIPTLAVSGFFTEEQAESIMKKLEEEEDL